MIQTDEDEIVRDRIYDNEVLVIGTRWRGTTPESGGFLYLMLGHHIKEF